MTPSRNDNVCARRHHGRGRTPPFVRLLLRFNRRRQLPLRIRQLLAANAGMETVGGVVPNGRDTREPAERGSHSGGPQMSQKAQKGVYGAGWCVLPLAPPIPGSNSHSVFSAPRCARQKNQSVAVAVVVAVADPVSLASRSKDRDFRQAHLVDVRHPPIVVVEPQPGRDIPTVVDSQNTVRRRSRHRHKQQPRRALGKL